MGQPVGQEHREERDEARAEQEEEGLEARQLEHERAERPERRRQDYEEPLRSAGHEVLQRDRTRVGVRERLVGLRGRQRDEREERDEPTGRDRGRQRGGIGDVAGQEHDRAEREQQRVRDPVAEARPPERRPRTSREARVVGRERDPRDRDADDDVDPLPRRETALTGSVPRLLEPASGERPPGEIGDSERHHPDGDAADDRADDSDRAEQPERERCGTEDERPGPTGLDPEELVGERRRRGRDHEQFEHRPAEALHDVDCGREIGATLSERQSQRDHRRDACLGADRAGEREHQVADQAADEDRCERARQRERRHEDRPGDDDE